MSKSWQEGLSFQDKAAALVSQSFSSVGDKKLVLGNERAYMSSCVPPFLTCFIYSWIVFCIQSIWDISTQIFSLLPLW